MARCQVSRGSHQEFPPFYLSHTSFSNLSTFSPALAWEASPPATPPLQARDSPGIGPAPAMTRTNYSKLSGATGAR